MPIDDVNVVLDFSLSNPARIEEPPLKQPQYVIGTLQRSFFPQLFTHLAARYIYLTRDTEAPFNNSNLETLERSSSPFTWSKQAGPLNPCEMVQCSVERTIETVNMQCYGI